MFKYGIGINVGRFLAEGSRCLKPTKQLGYSSKGNLMRKIMLQFGRDKHSHAQQLSENLTPLLLKNLSDEINHGFFIIDQLGKLAFANKAFLKLLGLQHKHQDQIRDTALTDYFTKESLLFFLEQVKPSLTKKKSWFGEIDLINQKKKIIRASCEFAPIHGEPYYACWISQLSGDKVLLCQNLDEAIDFFHTLFEMAPNPIYLMDLNGKLLIANRMLSQVTGYSKTELLNKNITDIEKTINTQKQLASIIKEVRKKGSLLLHGEKICKNSSTFPVEINLKEVMLCGNPGILVYLHDISQREKYQQQAKQNYELRNLITKVTNHFSLVSLNSFDKAADDALGDLGKFAEVDRCYLFKFTDDLKYMSNTHEWCSKKIKPVKEMLQNLLISNYKWMLKKILKEKVIAIDATEKLPTTGEANLAREEFLREGIKSLLILPLMRGKTIFGTVGFDAVAHHLKWTPEIIQLLADFSNFIAQALDRRETLLLQEEKKKLESLLTKKLLDSTEGELAFFIKNVPSPIAIFDRHQRYVAVSDRWLHDFHIAERKVIGKRFDDIFKAAPISWKKAYKDSLAGKTIINEKEGIINRNGQTEWLKWKTYPRKDQDGKTCGVIVLAEDITERINYEERILHMTKHDALTDIPNRVYFYETLSNLLLNNQKDKGAVIVLAINNLDNISNCYNLFVGDMFVQKLSTRIRNLLPKNVFFARLEGGRFAMILKNSRNSQIRQLIKEINASVSRAFHVHNYQVRTTLSFGIRTFKIDGQNHEQLLKDAEIALQQSKSDTNAQITYFNLDLADQHFRKLSLENDMQQAIETSQFYMLYQPYFSLQNDKFVGFEALARWQHPKLKTISPLEFIPIAEKTGKMIALGYWILHQALSDIKRLLPTIKGSDYYRFSINLSLEQLLDKNFLFSVKKIIAQHEVPTNLLQFEITETKLFRNNAEEVQILNNIQKMGCHIAIDDFGTGHSALERLRELPVSTLKIDKCFVDDVDKNEKSTALVKHILLLASELKIMTIAEGIERKAQKHILQLLGCDIGQGFYYSKPIPFEQLKKKYF